MSLRPLVAICGTTGVGKSKLAIELALALSRGHAHGYRGARIINADSMQVYAGMDIITNKVPAEEQAGIEHLLMGFKQPGEQYVVGQWIRDAMQLIDETHARNQIPIVVGGTSYWIQHLLFPDRLVSIDKPMREDDSALAEPVPTAPTSEALKCALESLPPRLTNLYNNLPEQASVEMDTDIAFTLHNLLSLLDPIVAQRWHWKDTRKVLRSLNIIKTTGRLSSEIITEQSEVIVEPRYRTLCFWLYAKPEVLNPRLDSRVDEMLQRGLLQEVRDLTDLASNADSHAGSLSQSGDQEVEPSQMDYTLGIYQSIGYREFVEYLKDPSSSQNAFRDAVERMKLSTRKYAKRQVQWLRNKLLPAAYAANLTSQSRGNPPVVPTYLLDATELGDSWKKNVQNVAEEITQDFLEERVLPDPLSLSDSAQEMLTIKEKPTNPTEVLNARRKVTCPSCTTNPEQPIMIDEEYWELHVKSRFHRRFVKKRAKAENPDGWKPQYMQNAKPRSGGQNSDTM